jgi:FtsP/CotA-like multicopper oxidase with cupredoxin domain
VNLVFTNPSPESHTIHLHGLDVDQANDGVPTTSFMVIQGENGAYSFTATQPGTFLYHCHVTTTLHLTMGMYGMILVRHPDGTLFEGGPTYNSDAPLLFSDLEIATNLAPVQSFPFHDIRPDYFMVNGLSGSQLDDGPQILSCPTGQQLALRLGSMAYSRTRIIFPSSINATCWMSDGRPVPSPFPVETLDIYPGERYTVLISSPDPTFDGDFEVQYWDMLDGQLSGSNFVRFRDAALDIEDINTPTPLKVYPNPVSDILNLGETADWSISDILGKIILTGSGSTVDVRGFAPGQYQISRSDNSPGTPFVVQ